MNYFEVWNEPDGIWCWKHGPNAVELGEFTVATAKAVKEVRPDAKIIGGVVLSRALDFLNTALKTGMADLIDYVSFHEYTADERLVFEKVASFRALIKLYNPNIGIIQGESGSQSRGDGNGALRRGAWTEEIQAKQLARHTVTDLITDVHFLSYFSCMDMIEALNGDVNDKASYLDYGYFGILRTEFDEDGKPPVQLEWDMKLWWPQCETMIALRLAYILFGDEKYNNLYNEFKEYCEKYFCDTEDGEWYGYLHYDDTVSTTLKGIIFKGPFHVPRLYMIMSIMNQYNSIIKFFD